MAGTVSSPQWRWCCTTIYALSTLCLEQKMKKRKSRSEKREEKKRKHISIKSQSKKQHFNWILAIVNLFSSYSIAGGLATELEKQKIVLIPLEIAKRFHRLRNRFAANKKTETKSCRQIVMLALSSKLKLKYQNSRTPRYVHSALRPFYFAVACHFSLNILLSRAKTTWFRFLY